MLKTQNIIRVLSKKGVCSRKQAVDFVKDGRVKINGHLIYDPGKQVNSRDKILFDNKPISNKRKRYIILHKPAGYVTTRHDELGRKTVYDLLKDINDWIIPVGRLDQDSEGLLIFTNDTAFGDKLTDPMHNVPRTYEVLIDGSFSEHDLAQIRRGTEIGRGEKTRPSKIDIIKQDDSVTFLSITLTEGKNREIRRLFEVFGKKVIKLVRTQFGPYKLGNLPQGKWIEIGSIVK